MCCHCRMNKLGEATPHHQHQHQHCANMPWASHFQEPPGMTAGTPELSLHNSTTLTSVPALCQGRFGKQQRPAAGTPACNGGNDSVQEVEERLEHAISKLQALLPEGYPLHKLQAVLVEAPTLIFRMDYYHDARTLLDLPPDLRSTLMR
jgi:hypothetical protein